MATNALHKRKREESIAKRSGVCVHPDDFTNRVRRDRHRLSILMEGDSWFDYPPKYVVAGRQRNISEWMKYFVSKRYLLANILSVSENGDTAKNMSGPPGSNEILRIIKKMGFHLNYLLISAGGNDIVGKEILGFLNDFERGFTAKDCLNDDFHKKIDNIKENYRVALDYIGKNVRKCNVISHSYCYLKPEIRGFKFLIVRLGDGWICRYLNQKGIPSDMHQEVVKEMLDNFHDMLLSLSCEFNNFHVVDFRSGVLDPGSYRDWADEMHPTSSGFKKLAKKFLDKVKELEGAP